MVSQDISRLKLKNTSNSLHIIMPIRFVENKGDTFRGEWGGGRGIINCTVCSLYKIYANYAPVHHVESVENCGLCMRWCFACSSYTNIMDFALVIKCYVCFIVTPAPSNELRIIASYRLFTLIHRLYPLLTPQGKLAYHNATMSLLRTIKVTHKY